MSSFDPASIPPVLPTPVQALPYSIPVRYGRPGIITAIGVMCIVVACLSGITSFGSGVYSFGFFMLSRMSTIATRSAAISSASVSTAQTASLPGPLSAGDVGVAVNSLKSKLSLDGPLVRELDRLLRLHGREVLGGDDDTPLTAAIVDGLVQASGTFPSVAHSPAQFQTPQGVVVVYPDHASFTATHGSVTISTSARHHFDERSAVSTNTLDSHTPSGLSYHLTSTATLSSAQVATVVAAVTSINTTLNGSQLASLQKELAKPNQILVTPAAAAPGGRPVISSFAPQGGNAVIMFDTGSQLVLGPTGQVISSGPPAFPKFNISGPLVVTLIADAIGSIALAIYLLVIGIQVFRASFRGQRLLKIYAWLKIPLALVAGTGLSLLGYQFAKGITVMAPYAGSAASTAPMTAGFVIWGCIVAALGLAFPIGLLIALHSRTVKDYYNAVASEH